MSAYQKLIEFQDEVERLTGVRPSISVYIHHCNSGFDDEEALSARNTLISDSNNILESDEHKIYFQEGSKFNSYTGINRIRGIHYYIHGPVYGGAEFPRKEQSDNA